MIHKPGHFPPRNYRKLLRPSTTSLSGAHAKRNRRKLISSRANAQSLSGLRLSDSPGSLLWFRLVSRSLPRCSTATLAALRAMSLIPFAPFFTADFIGERKKVEGRIKNSSLAKNFDSRRCRSLPASKASWFEAKKRLARRGL